MPSPAPAGRAVRAALSLANQSRSLKRVGLFIAALCACGAVFLYAHTRAAGTALFSRGERVAARADGDPGASPLREAVARKLQTEGKVKVELFVMSQCPFGVRAEEALAPVLKEFGGRVDFRLHFIANQTDAGFKSLHGQAEVDEDIRQTAMAERYPRQYFDYVAARAADYRGAAWQPLAEAAGIDPAQVEDLARSEEGRRLFADDISLAAGLKIHASPTVLLDGEKYAGRIQPVNAPAADCNAATPAAAPPPPSTSATTCNSDADCNDFNACTNDACVNNNCVNTPKTCDDNNACTNDACDIQTGQCVNSPLICDDNNPNTKDTCDVQTGCVFTPTCTANPVVTNTNDGGAGSLRDAIASVCAGDTISFDTAAGHAFDPVTAPHTITLTSGELAVGKSMTIGTFTQDDINNNLITYANGGGGFTSDSFNFTVSDGAGGSIGSTAFQINVNPQPTLSIDDVTHAEGNSGTTDFTFTVTKTGSTAQTVTVNYATADGTATAPSDYAATVGINTLTFAPDEAAKTVTVKVNGDTTVEPDETFTVHLSGESNATISDADGTGTIQDDDGVDYTVTTTGGAIVVTDVTGHGDTLIVAEPAAGQTRFAAAGRNFSVDGSPVTRGDSGNLSLSGIGSITINQGGGDDTLSVQAFTSTLPSLKINGDAGDDAVNFNGSVTFNANANLDVNLQDDTATPGADSVTVASGVQLITSGTGTIDIRVSKGVTVGGLLQTQDGALNVEANRQATPTSGAFVGVGSAGGTFKTTGAGNISIKGTGGAGDFQNNIGVQFLSGTQALTTGTGTITIIGDGGAGSGGASASGGADRVSTLSAPPFR